MTSLRNIEQDRETDRSTADRLLDAARTTILTIGWKRTTLTEVARRAGLSRMTVYRTYPDMTALFGDLMTREWATLAASVLDSGDSSAPWPDRVATGLVRTVAALRDDELFRRIVEVDPELVLPYLLQRPGRSQQALLRLVADRVAAGQAAGGLRDGDPALLARGLVLAAHGFLLSARTMTDASVGTADLDGELGALVRGYLAR